MIAFGEYRRLVLVLLAAAIGAGCARTAPTRDPVHVQFCDLVRQARHYEGELVAFHAHIDSDGMERSALTHPGCPGHGAAFDVSSAGDTFFDADHIVMGVGLPGTVDKVVEADFVGVLHVSHGKRLIDITSVRNVSYRMIKEGEEG